MDSGATIVEIKLKDMGMESIEVTDNGSGIDKANYETLALKHHTSKLNEFTDLENGYVTSFGFRGEALNAVCELSREFTVTTKQENEKVGFALSFQRNGKYGLCFIHFNLFTRRLVSLTTNVWFALQTLCTASSRSTSGHNRASGGLVRSSSSSQRRLRQVSDDDDS